MSIPLTAPEILDREFFEIRAKLLEVAASFDRLDRGDESVLDDPRMNLIRQAINILTSGREGRAEELQLLFSREYEDDWQKKFNIQTA